MSLPNPAALGDMIHWGVSAAIGNTIYIPVMRPGRAKSFAVSIGAAVTAADETFTLAYAPPGSTTFTNVTNGTVLQPTSGSAAGTTVVAQLTPGSTCDVIDGGTFRITPSGGGSGAAPISFAITVGN